ncbi:hypothetical protein J6590_012359 [Homalodisca vitripennis]|nr:hypothetical protein J6590_012359 [Homalodisca vitripennis]
MTILMNGLKALDLRVTTLEYSPSYQETGVSLHESENKSDTFQNIDQCSTHTMNLNTVVDSLTSTHNFKLNVKKPPISAKLLKAGQTTEEFVNENIDDFINHCTSNNILENNSFKPHVSLSPPTLLTRNSIPGTKNHIPHSKIVSHMEVQQGFLEEGPNIKGKINFFKNQLI